MGVGATIHLHDAHAKRRRLPAAPKPPHRTAPLPALERKGRPRRRATPTQHQLLLAIRGHADPRGPTVGDVAGHLLLRHHSAVELIDRAEAAGLVTRRPDADNQSVVRLHLTDRGSRQLEALSELHLEELAHLAPTMHTLWEALERDSDGGPRATPHPAAPPREPSAPPPRHDPRRRL